MTPALYDIWLDSKPVDPSLPFAVQLRNYVGHFSSEDAAERYIAAIQAQEEQQRRKK